MIVALLGVTDALHRHARPERGDLRCADKVEAIADALDHRLYASVINFQYLGRLQVCMARA